MVVWLFVGFPFYHIIATTIELSFMFAKLMVRSYRMASVASFPAMNAIRASTSIGIQQRNFGVFSSIRENVNEKLEEKKKKTAGLIQKAIAHK